MSSISTRTVAAIAVAATFILNVQGAFLRAAGLGDGCGTSWPGCHGEVVPLDPDFAAFMEFYGHRILSIVVGLIGLWLLVRAVRERHQHPGLLTFVIAAGVFYLAQTFVGMATVMGGWTGDSTDPIRAVILPIHLVNSFSMLAALVLAMVYAGPNPPGRWRVTGRRSAAIILGIATVALYGLTFTGGVAALGNLFAPVDTVAEGVVMDFSPDAHWTVRVRVLHPIIAITLGTGLAVACATAAVLRRSRPVTKAAGRLGIAYTAQLGIGVANWLALAPLPLTIIHQALAMIVVGFFAAFVATSLGNTPGDAQALSNRTGARTPA